MKPRAARARLARETVEILEQGGYRLADGRRVAIAEWLAAARRGTRVFTPDELAALDADTNAPAGAPPAIRVLNASTLAAARALADAHGPRAPVPEFRLGAQAGRRFPQGRPGPGGGAGARDRALRLPARGRRLLHRQPPLRHRALHRPHDPRTRRAGLPRRRRPPARRAVSRVDRQRPGGEPQRAQKNEPSMLREARPAMRRRMSRLLGARPPPRPPATGARRLGLRRVRPRARARGGGLPRPAGPRRPLRRRLRDRGLRRPRSPARRAGVRGVPAVFR
ncbi:MAG: DUF2263 domain-containing protein [Halofilum sp. (in: g-proteobacteria)]|nr:DUF2263 domain-containing protein [Halofilum sp. (in: g-proteobacteria)]